MLQTDTSRLNLMIDGDNHSDTIILLHGGPGVPDYLSEVASILSKNFRTVRFDQRGVGKSESLNESYTIDEYLYDIDQIIEHLKIDKVHIFGHSWGGLLAQLWVSRNKDKTKSLFLSSPSSGTGDVWKIMEKEVMSYNKGKASTKEWVSIGLNSLPGLVGVDQGYKNIFKLLWKFYFKEPAEADDAEENWLSGISANAVNKTRKSVVSIKNEDLEKSLNDFDKPTTVIFGDYDIYGESKEVIKARFSDINYRIMKNSGHLPWIQSAVDYKKILYEFYDLPH